MDRGARDHVSGKLDVDEVLYCDLKQAVCSHTNLVGATSTRAPTAMDISSIATVIDGEERQPQHHPTQPHVYQPTICGVDEAGWPVDEEGWHVDGYFDEHTLNFVKGAKRKRERQKGKRKFTAPWLSWTIKFTRR